MGLGCDTSLLDRVFDEVVDWLRQGEDSAINPVDWPWDVDVEESEDIRIARAFHPRAMLELKVIADYGNDLIRLMLDPLYPTKFLDNKERLRLYYSLLKLNLEAGLVKAALLGEDDGVVFIIDLDPRGLGKEEFNDAIEKLYLATASFVKAVGWEDEVSKVFMESVTSILVDKIEKGASREDILNYLISKLGMSRDRAEELVNTLFKGKEGVKMTI